ncbi:calmodulin-binding protein [Nonomuraea sp. AD125B]|uniref:BP74-related protein n=1 Tax=Nonomuraea sp. AD125B TaxID=3242897 RepID=UPI003529B293
MHHVLTKIMAVLAALATLSVATPAPAQAAVPAYFVMTDITRENFVVQLTDPAKIQHARDLISGTTTDKPHVLGHIVKRPAPYNPRWSYQLNPDTISFFDFGIEVCDATIPYVEDHLDEAGGAFLPGLVWCPWTSRLVREIPAL